MQGWPVRPPRPSKVTEGALRGDDRVSIEALEIFCTCLGRVAGDLALTTMAKGGVFISGGIAEKILPLLQESSFRAAFEDKAPHKRIIANIPTQVVVSHLPALVGLAAYANDPDTYDFDTRDRLWNVGL